MCLCGTSGQSWAMIGDPAMGGGGQVGPPVCVHVRPREWSELSQCVSMWD